MADKKLLSTDLSVDLRPKLAPNLSVSMDVFYPTEYYDNRLYYRKKREYKEEQEKLAKMIADTRDSQQLNSVADIILTTFQRGKDSKLKTAHKDGLLGAPVVNILPRYMEYAKNFYWNPVKTGRWGLALMNGLVNLGETTDILNNVVKAWTTDPTFLTPDPDWKTLYPNPEERNKAITQYEIDQTIYWGNKVKQALGFSKEGGRTTYDYDTGNMFGDIALEIFGDPTTWFSGGGLIKQGTKMLGSGPLAKKILAEMLKKAPTLLDDIGEEAAQKAVKKLVWRTISKMGNEGGDDFAKAFKKIATKADGNYKLFKFKNMEFTDAFRKSVDDLTDPAIDTMTMRVIKDITQMTSAIEKVDNFTAKLGYLGVPPIFAGYHAYKGTKRIKGYVKSAMERTYKGFRKEHGLLSLMDYEAIVDAANKRAGSLYKAHNKVDGPNMPKKSLVSLLRNDAQQDFIYIRTLLKESKDNPEQLLKIIENHFQTRHGATLEDYLAKIKDINDTTGNAFDVLEAEVTQLKKLKEHAVTAAKGQQTVAEYSAKVLEMQKSLDHIAGLKKPNKLWNTFHTDMPESYSEHKAAFLDYMAEHPIQGSLFNFKKYKGGKSFIQGRNVSELEGYLKRLPELIFDKLTKTTYVTPEMFPAIASTIEKLIYDNLNIKSTWKKTNLEFANALGKDVIYTLQHSLPQEFKVPETLTKDKSSRRAIQAIIKDIQSAQYKQGSPKVIPARIKELAATSLEQLKSILDVEYKGQLPQFLQDSFDFLGLEVDGATVLEKYLFNTVAGIKDEDLVKDAYEMLDNIADAIKTSKRGYEKDINKINSSSKALLDSVKNLEKIPMYTNIQKAIVELLLKHSAQILTGDASKNPETVFELTDSFTKFQNEILEKLGLTEVMSNYRTFGQLIQDRQTKIRNLIDNSVESILGITKDEFDAQYALVQKSAAKRGINISEEDFFLSRFKQRMAKPLKFDEAALPQTIKKANQKIQDAKANIDILEEANEKLNKQRKNIFNLIKKNDLDKAQQRTLQKKLDDIKKAINVKIQASDLNKRYNLAQKELKEAIADKASSDVIKRKQQVRDLLFKDLKYSANASEDIKQLKKEYAIIKQKHDSITQKLEKNSKVFSPSTKKLESLEDVLNNIQESIASNTQDIEVLQTTVETIEKNAGITRHIKQLKDLFTELTTPIRASSVEDNIRDSIERFVYAIADRLKQMPLDAETHYSPQALQEALEKFLTFEVLQEKAIVEGSKIRKVYSVRTEEAIGVFNDLKLQLETLSLDIADIKAPTKNNVENIKEFFEDVITSSKYGATQKDAAQKYLDALALNSPDLDKELEAIMLKNVFPKADFGTTGSSKLKHHQAVAVKAAPDAFTQLLELKDALDQISIESWIQHLIKLDADEVWYTAKLEQGYTSLTFVRGGLGRVIDKIFYGKGNPLGEFIHDVVNMKSVPLSQKDLYITCQNVLKNMQGTIDYKHFVELVFSNSKLTQMEKNALISVMQKFKKTRTNIIRGNKQKYFDEVINDLTDYIEGVNKKRSYSMDSYRKDGSREKRLGLSTNVRHKSDADNLLTLDVARTELNKTLKDGEYAVDIETTGLDATKHSVLEVSFTDATGHSIKFKIDLDKADIGTPSENVLKIWDDSDEIKSYEELKQSFKDHYSATKNQDKLKDTDELIYCASEEELIQRVSKFIQMTDPKKALLTQNGRKFDRVFLLDKFNEYRQSTKYLENKPLYDLLDELKIKDGVPVVSEESRFQIKQILEQYLSLRSRAGLNTTFLDPINTGLLDDLKVLRSLFNSSDIANSLEEVERNELHNFIWELRSALQEDIKNINNAYAEVPFQKGLLEDDKFKYALHEVLLDKIITSDKYLAKLDNIPLMDIDFADIHNLLLGDFQDTIAKIKTTKKFDPTEIVNTFRNKLNKNGNDPVVRDFLLDGLETNTSAEDIQRHLQTKLNTMLVVKKLKEAYPEMFLQGTSLVTVNQALSSWMEYLNTSKLLYTFADGFNMFGVKKLADVPKMTTWFNILLDTNYDAKMLQKITNFTKSLDMIYDSIKNPSRLYNYQAEITAMLTEGLKQLADGPLKLLKIDTEDVVASYAMLEYVYNTLKRNYLKNIENADLFSKATPGAILPSELLNELNLQDVAKITDNKFRINFLSDPTVPGYEGMLGVVVDKATLDNLPVPYKVTDGVLADASMFKELCEKYPHLSNLLDDPGVLKDFTIADTKLTHTEYVAALDYDRNLFRVDGIDDILTEIESDITKLENLGDMFDETGLFKPSVMKNTQGMRACHDMKSTWNNLMESCQTYKEKKALVKSLVASSDNLKMQQTYQILELAKDPKTLRDFLAHNNTITTISRNILDEDVTANRLMGALLDKDHIAELKKWGVKVQVEPDRFFIYLAQDTKKTLRVDFDTVTKAKKIYLGDEEIIRPVLKDLDFDQAFADFTKTGFETLTDSFKQSLKEVYGTLKYQSGDNSIGSSGELMTASILKSLYEQFPDSVKKEMYSIDYLTEPQFFTESVFNFVNLGPLRHQKELQQFLPKTIISSFITASKISMERASDKLKYLYELFKGDFRINTGAWADSKNAKEWVSYLKEHPEMCLAALVESKSSPEGFKVVKLTINNVKDFENAKRLEACLMPLQQYAKAYSILTSTKFHNGFLRTWSEITRAFKVSWLVTTGNWSRNYIDSTVKTINTTGEFLEVFKTQGEAIKLLRGYNKVLNQILSVSKLDIKQVEELAKIHGKTVQEVLNDIQFKVVKLQKQTCEAVVDAAILQDRYNTALQDILKMDAHKSLSRENISFYFKNLAKDSPIDEEMFYVVHNYLLDSTSAGPTKNLQKYYTEVAKSKGMYKDVSVPKQIYNYLIELGLKPNYFIEQTVRLSQHLIQLRNGMDFTKSTYMLNKTHFDYSAKTDVTRFIELLFPFYNFKMRNMEYWLDAFETNPALARMITNIYTPIWNFDEYDPKERAQNPSLEYQILSGNIPLTDSGVTLKVNPSFMDVAQMVGNPLGAIQGALFGPLQLVLKAVLENEIKQDGEDSIPEFWQNTLGYNEYTSEHTDMKQSLLEQIPVVGTILQGKRMRDTYYARTGNPLNRISASMFGATSRWKNLQKKPKVYNSGGKVPKAWYRKKSYKKYKRNYKVYAKRYYYKDFNNYNYRPYKVYDNDYKRFVKDVRFNHRYPIQAYSNYYSNLKYPQDVDIYDKYYTAKGKRRMDTLLAPTTPENLVWQMRVMQRFYR